MIELLLSIGLTFGFSAQPAPMYEITGVGVSGFTGYTIEEESTPPETVQQDEIVFAQSLTEDRAPETATRSEAREAPVENNPVSQEPVISPEPVAPPSGGILGIAASYVGFPYVLYGSPPLTFDCSSYVWWVYKQAGINIPVSVNGQKGAVTPVSNPQPGDLIFYNDFHHVGIYAGNGMTYEALNPSAGVRYGPLVSNNVWYGRIG